jgi:hypothetical protein
MHNPSHDPRPQLDFLQERTMTKLAIFLFGFLALTIGIGILATIPPT